MEIDFIFLKKEKAKSDSSLKELVLELLGKIFVEVDGKIYYEDEKKQKQEICCQTAHCGRRKPHNDFGVIASPIVPYRNLPQTTDGMTADCRSIV